MCLVKFLKGLPSVDMRRMIRVKAPKTLDDAVATARAYLADDTSLGKVTKPVYINQIESKFLATEQVETKTTATAEPTIRDIVSAVDDMGCNLTSSISKLKTEIIQVFKEHVNSSQSRRAPSRPKNNNLYCFYCRRKGHFRRNCRKRIADERASHDSSPSNRVSEGDLNASKRN